LVLNQIRLVRRGCTVTIVQLALLLDIAVVIPLCLLQHLPEISAGPVSVAVIRGDQGWEVIVVGGDQVWERERCLHQHPPFGGRDSLVEIEVVRGDQGWEIVVICGDRV
jgi:hypothetical protein